MSSSSSSYVQRERAVNVQRLFHKKSTGCMSRCLQKNE
ncbi:hypothetical protein BCBMB205_17060 [Bacillus sp. CN2]|nr:hypothetical protein BCBMB205_17060 [Bacillus velezensis]ARZ58040.1 hypothetical protein BAGQ_1806 [Bacillus velezensis]GFR53498.1 hypothetical protein BCBMB205_17060 [Bacillus sp. CN2]